MESEYEEKFRPGKDDGIPLSLFMSWLYFDFDCIVFSELGTDQKWTVYRVNEPFEKEASSGDIWYLRLVGTPVEAYIYTHPFIYPPETKVHLTKVVKQQKKILLSKDFGKRLPKKDIFRESCKATVPFWSDFFLGNIDAIVSADLEIEEEQPEKLILCNTDGELLSFSKIYFHVKERKGLRNKLSSLRGFDYDEKQKEWIWFK